MVRKNILLVEDDPGDQQLILRALNRNNAAVEVLLARDGVEALERIFGDDMDGEPMLDKPSLVLVDIKMPRLDGFEVLEKIRGDSRTCMVPVVMLTSSDSEEDVRRSYRLGANSYIRKPMKLNDLIELMEQLKQYWLVFNVSPP